jgi:hypothetical protein
MKLVTLKDYLNSVGYKITGGGEFGWNCYGENIFCIDSEKMNKAKNYTFSTDLTFNTKTFTVYEMNSWDYKKKIIYLWVHPRYYKKYLKENKERGINPFKDEEGYQILEVSATKILRETKNVMNK